MVHVLKARILHPSFDLRTRLGILAEVNTGATSETVPFPHRVLRCQRPVFGVDAEVVLLELGVAAGLCVLETLAYQLLPVAQRWG